MKLKSTFNIQHSTANSQRLQDSRHSMLGVECSRLNVSRSPRHASRRPHQSRSGIALVITLIMLSVTLVMAVAFLALARRERGAVTVTTDTTTARLAMESALAQAQGQIIANILASTNLGAYNYGLLVSTNYQNPFGYVPGFPNPTNVNYDYRFDNNLFTPDDRIQNIANLYFLPRPPVFVTTNRATGSNEFRYFLDLNRNGKFEANGLVANVDSFGFTNGTIPEIGDPEWVGILERPDQPHGPNNKFLARYAFFAQPIGNSLDLNYIHNQALNSVLGGADGFFRNEGVGSWELNLAAFLADLNTNQWNPPTVVNPAINPYLYRQPAFFNTGAAFEDAYALLVWRYAKYNLLAFPSGAANDALLNWGVDVYSIGPLMTNTFLPFATPPIRKYWAGSDNTNRYFALPSDLFDTSKGLGNFPNHLLAASTNVSTYDRYTFYRMLDELGTDSALLDSRMNLNYSNVLVSYSGSSSGSMVTNIAVVPFAETNAMPWRPLDFFTAAADRMLRHYTTNWFAANPRSYLWTYYGLTTNDYKNYYIAPNGLGLTNLPFYGMTNQVPAFGITNIPVYVYVNGHLDGHSGYSPAVNRLLQLAANLYDASTNTFYPSVFRPVFYRDSAGSLFINSYVDISKANTIAVGTPPLDLPVFDDSLLRLGAGVNEDKGNAYGVPWIIGAKKGLPNFNELYMRNAVQLTRKLEVTRATASKKGADATNQMFVMSITNRLGFSFWNSYNTNYVASVPNGLTVCFHDLISMGLTNNAPKAWQSFYGQYTTFPYTFITNLNSWTGSTWTNYGISSQSSPVNGQAVSQSFIAGVYDFPFLPESIFRASLNDFVPVALNPNPLWETTGPSVPVFPQFGLMTTNRVQAIILDGNHVIDYVQLSGPNGARSLNAEIMPKVNDNLNTIANMWSTNQNAFKTAYGVANQIEVSRKPSLIPGISWKTPPLMPQGINTVDLEAQYFDAFFTGVPLSVTVGDHTRTVFNTNLIEQVPYTPTRTAWDFVLWQANDPLVHYISSDLNTTTRDTHPDTSDNLINKAMPNPSLVTAGDRYQPWGRNQQMAFLGETSVDTNQYNLRFRDPLVWGSDDWHFPTGKYPAVGWLGRVHRGTPWQTVFLKQRDVLDETITTPGGIANVGVNTWAQWTGDTQTVFNQQYDAVNSAPLQDRDLFDLFTTQFNDNATRGTLSVNQTHLAAWSAVFSGLVALTNYTDVPASFTAPWVTNLIVSPAGVDGNNSALGQLVNGPHGIFQTRAAFTNADGLVGAFEHVGDILSVPAYSEQSPFLNFNPEQQRFDLSDELYEWLPQQTLGLLRCSSAPRYVVYGYGQTLTPAPGGEFLGSGNYFKLVTNYQVTAETAVRAVLRVEKQVTPTSTNYSTVIESYNLLPP